jgi:hypothetical protein
LTQPNRQLFLLLKLDLLAKQFGVAGIFGQQCHYRGSVLGLSWDHFVIDASQAQALLVVRRSVMRCPQGAIRLGASIFRAVERA